MTITLAGLASDASARWRRDRGTLLALAGPFLFLPLFAWLLLLDEPVPKPGATDAERMQLVIDWAGANLHWLAARVGVELFGSLAILALYLSRGHRDVAGLLRQSLVLLPGFVAAVLASWGLVALGVFAFILPGMYIYGRVALTGPVLAAEPGVGIFGAITRSMALTRGHGWQVFDYLALTLLIGMLAAQVIGAIEVRMAAAGAINPVAIAILDALAAAAVSATALARLLLEVALYRRLAAPRHRV